MQVAGEQRRVNLFFWKFAELNDGLMDWEGV